MSTIANNRSLVDIDVLLAEVRRIRPRAAVAREAARLRREEIDGSLAIAGTPLSPFELDALLDRGVTAGAHPLPAYVAARDYAVAALWVAENRVFAPADPRPLATTDDLRRLHALTVAGQPSLRPGAWRLGVDVPHDAVVSPPPWLVPMQTAASLERVRRPPPPGDLPAWIAAFLARQARIRPFTGANGRTARLAAGLLLRRLDVPPLTIPRERATAYRAAIVAAESGDATPLTAIVAGALAQSCRRLLAAGGDDPLVPLRALAGADYAALIKAAKRGRLATVTRDGRIFTTAGWIAAYRNARRGTLPR